ncbi:FAD-dependent monooxygenase [Xanthobacter autotrophicus]|uniref:FAD-dependent monooxygenase n=1 Tax=Xanthobacter TaxID=279 RepID=UPI0024AB26EF|nr:FAD-dependent monooxygenase [Xanthobacter autotrophicus]MDI4665476.1 FAD-dependent monooxygenase [Xanthobacter autotrophicus]
MVRQDSADVIVVGAGPVGLSLAAELARHKVRCRILEKAAAPSIYCRALGVTPRTLEVYEDMGVVRAMIDAGLWLDGLCVAVDGAPARTIATDLSDLPYGALGIPQPVTERILAEHLAGFGIGVERGVAVNALVQAGEKVRLDLAGPDGREDFAHARFVVGCDGAHSFVRHALGIPFEGEAFPYPFMLGDVHLAFPGDLKPARGIALRLMRLREDTAPDMFIAIPLPEHGRYRVSMLAPESLAGAGSGDAGSTEAHGIQSERPGPSLADLQEVADRIAPGQIVAGDLRWSSRFRISMRLAARYRAGQVFLAGDACHIHPPTGGQGMNTGIQDAYNLAWKLALVLRGRAPAALLDSYEAERRPVAQDVIARTVAESVNIGASGGARDRLADTQIRVSYAGLAGAALAGGAGAPEGLPGDRLPVAGDRAPDAPGLMRRGVGTPFRMFDLLRGTDFVAVAALDGTPDGLAAAEALGAVLAGGGLPIRVVAVAPAGSGLADPCGVSLVEDGAGAFAAAYGLAAGEAVLVRPDGYLAWRGNAAEADVALRRVVGAG